MLNSYKTVEENEAIFSATWRHHEVVAAKGYLVVFTSLVGSQNYNLDGANSDIDTFSFVLPTLNDIALAKEPVAGQFEVDDGICNYKDIRLALNLLRKTSPNSVEYFASKYKVYNPVFEPLLREYLDDNASLWSMLHCNYSHMLYAMAGMAHQLSKRNMPAGKRYAHALRLRDMYYNFLNNPNAIAVLDMRSVDSRDVALLAKCDTDTKNDETYNNGCDYIAEWLNERREEFELTKEFQMKQQVGYALIDTLQWKLFKLYLEGTLK